MLVNNLSATVFFSTELSAQGEVGGGNASFSTTFYPGNQWDVTELKVKFASTPIGSVQSWEASSEPDLVYNLGLPGNISVATNFSTSLQDGHQFFGSVIPFLAGNRTRYMAVRLKAINPSNNEELDIVFCDGSYQVLPFPGELIYPNVQMNVYEGDTIDMRYPIVKVEQGLTTRVDFYREAPNNWAWIYGTDLNPSLPGNCLDGLSMTQELNLFIGEGGILQKIFGTNYATFKAIFKIDGNVTAEDEHGVLFLDVPGTALSIEDSYITVATGSGLSLGKEIHCLSVIASSPLILSNATDGWFQFRIRNADGDILCSGSARPRDTNFEARRWLQNGDSDTGLFYITFENGTSLQWGWNYGGTCHLDLTFDGCANWALGMDIPIPAFTPIVVPPEPVACYVESTYEQRSSGLRLYVNIVGDNAEDLSDYAYYEIEGDNLQCTDTESVVANGKRYCLEISEHDILMKGWSVPDLISVVFTVGDITYPYSFQFPSI